MENDEMTRRDFVTMTVAAGIAAAAGTNLTAQQKVTETNVNIKTTDGMCDPTFRAKLTPLMGSINAEGAAERDAAAFIEWLDAQREVDRSKKIGTQGYCMGGALVVRTAAAVPNRVGAGASFHGGGLVTANPNSPHLLAPKIKARMYIAIATNDDMQQPDAKTKLKESFEAAKVPAEIEVYSQAQHGWCVSDMPKQANGQPIYSKPDADRAWGKLLALYKAGLSAPAPKT